ncbi:MAG: glycoside hydrolase family 127 protein [Kiritimatiellaeota bacterium]|nr:glycoside hydrolase family 127 protein [Kiritimatiellota bacterium]
MPKITRRLSAIPLKNVAITDGFWKERLETNRTAIIPAEHKQCKETGRLDVWSWKPGMPNEPHIYWDSDVAKWIEAVAYARYDQPDPEAEAQVDEYVESMRRGQAPDGYCNSHYILVEPEMRWTDLRNCHELYCAGHFIEAAVAYHQATGKDALLNIMLRYVDCIAAKFGTGEGQLRGIPGHPEIELALVKLYRHTGDPKHLALAGYFVNERGSKPYWWDVETEAWKARGGYRGWSWAPEYSQSEAPARELSVVRGHAVRAMYFYSAMADIAAESGDAALLEACNRLWDDLTRHKLYVTGGIGSSRANEGFTDPYDLPNETAYSETCAAIGLVFWARRLLAITPDRRYADLIELALYNAIMSGVSLDGVKFFYDNPLASAGKHTRQPWFGCSCCPTNVGRLLAALPQYIADKSDDGIWIHQYMTSRVEAEIDGATVFIFQKTEYPRASEIDFIVTPTAPVKFTLRLRVPAWANNQTLSINNKPAPCEPDTAGYISITREWVSGDTVKLTLPLTPRYVHARPEVGYDAGRAVLMRGPVVYCVEEADNGKNLAGVVLPEISEWRECGTSLPTCPSFKHFTLLETDAARAPVPCDSDAPLYSSAPQPLAPKKLRAIPYALWDNRGVGEMRVWMLV